jgi:hypothetical protein
MPEELVAGGVRGAVVCGTVVSPGMVGVPGIVVATVSEVPPGVVVEVSELRTLVVVIVPGMVVSDGIDEVESVGAVDDVGA